MPAGCPLQRWPGLGQVMCTIKVHAMKYLCMNILVLFLNRVLWLHLKPAAFPPAYARIYRT